MFTQELDLNRFYEQGFLVTEIERPVADAMLSEIQKEAWVSVVPEDNEGKDNPYARNYQSRFVAAESMLRPLSPKPVYAAYRDAFMAWASVIFDQYDHAQRALVTALAGGEGYHMDLHADAGDRSLFTTLLYLGHEVTEPNPYAGDLELFRVDVHAPHEGEKSLLSRVAPLHGRVVIMNNLDPTVYHRVTPYTRPGGLRYSLFGSFGINDSPEWHYEGQVPVSRQGTILNPRTPITMGDVDWVANALEESPRS